MTDKTLPTIQYDDLVKNLENPNSDLDYYLQYMIEVPDLDQMVPDLAPNPALVEGIRRGLKVALHWDWQTALCGRAVKKPIATGSQAAARPPDRGRGRQLVSIPNNLARHHRPFDERPRHS